MGLTPQQVLTRFMNMCQSGEIEDVTINHPTGALMGYLFSAPPVYCLITPHNEVARDLCSFLERSGGEALLMRKVQWDPVNVLPGNLGLLTDEERECIELRDYPVRVIASKIGRSPSTVRRRLASARAKLQHVVAGV